jgi:hypothetical protein
LKFESAIGILLLDCPVFLAIPQFANSGDVLSVNTLSSGNRFTGRIPQETSNLTRLFLLSLAYVPVLKMGAYIPQEISNLTRL